MNNMRVVETAIRGVYLVEVPAFRDARGWFSQSYTARDYASQGVGPFVQDNVSRSSRGVVRGLHLQHPRAQGKLVMCLEGTVLDVAVDVRVGSPTFGKWVAEELTGDNHRQLWIPAGFAHGFAVISDTALFSYKCTGYYAPENELGVAFDDPDLRIPWPVDEPMVSEKDLRLPRLKDIPKSRLPQWVG